MEIEGLAHVATYEREVAASLERVWENVLDWEHLPWLHRASFCGIERIESGSWGWRARVGMQPVSRPREFVMELLVERDAERYVSRTLEGSAAGTEIWTSLRPVEDALTAISVEFHVPGLGPGRAGPVGASYRELYARLWDEDEAMMQRRARLLSAPAAPPASGRPLRLGSRGELLASLPRRVRFAGREFRIVDLDGELVAFASRCPHMLGPLDEGELDGGAVRCPWHGYRFDLRSGRCLGSPGLRLPPAPRVVVDPVSEEVRLEAR